MRPHALLSATLLACASTAVAADGNVQLHGYASQGYLYSVSNDYLDNTTEGTPQFTEVGLNATASPAERVTLGIAISAQDLGRYGNMKPGIDWAYGRYEIPKTVSWLDANVTVGRVKMGYGLYGDQVDLDMTRSSVFLPQVAYSPAFRDLFLAANGVQLNLSINAGKLGSFDISAMTGSNNIDESNVGIAETFVGPMKSLPAPFSGAIVQTDSVSIGRTDIASLTWNPPVDGLRIKGSVIHAEDVQASGRGVTNEVMPINFTFQSMLHNYVAIIAGAEYQRGDWTFAGEYVRQYIKFATTLNTTAFPGFPTKTITYQDSDSAYLTTAYRFKPAWEAVLTVSAANTTDENSSTDDSANWHRGISAALRWDVTDHFLLKGEFQRNHGDNLLSATDNPKGTDTYWSLFAVKATFDF